MKPYIKSILSNIAGIFFLSYGFAQIPEEVKSEIQNRTDMDINPSVVLAVHDSLGDHYFSAGYRDLKKRVPANQKTYYRLGNLGNTLTALLATQLSVSGIIVLDSALGNLVTPPLPVKDLQGHSISIRDVANYRSGISDIKGISISSNAHWDALYEDSQLLRLSPYRSGTSFQYSDWAMALLGAGLAEFTKTPYSTLLIREVLEPLHLNMAYLPPGTLRESLATGRSSDENLPSLPQKLSAPTLWWATTAEGLLDYGKKILLNPPSMQETVKKTLSGNPGTENDPATAMGWLVDHKGNFYHTGHYSGFNTFMAIDPVNKRVISLATNTDNADITDIGFYLLDPETHPLQRFVIHPIDPVSLEGYAGTYINNAMEMELELQLEQGVLKIIREEDTLSLHFMGDHRFFYKGLKAYLEFERNEDDQIVGVVLNKNGKKVLFIKIE